ncbi:MAG: hypothetical protein DRJ11_04410 [Candidatus Aminicenantes bacterium]|nr:MAG: hypothetical protein DRJ11_04410 [Candidatus Aminicenantes bacterium]
MNKVNSEILCIVQLFKLENFSFFNNICLRVYEGPEELSRFRYLGFFPWLEQEGKLTLLRRVGEMGNSAEKET